jgi:hypothetical protein
MVLELPPAPAALVLLGRWFAVFSARSAAAFLRMTVAGPPGGFGDAMRAVEEPEGVLTGEVGRGADCRWRRRATPTRESARGELTHATPPIAVPLQAPIPDDRPL